MVKSFLLLFLDNIEFCKKLNLINTYIGLDQYKEANELIETVLKNSNNSIDMYYVLKLKFLRLRKTIPNSNKIVNLKEIQEIIILIEHKIKEEIDDNYFLIRLFLINLKLFVIRQRLEDKNDNKNLKNEIIKLEDEFYNLQKDLRTVNEDIKKEINWIYSNLTYCFSELVRISENGFEKLLKKAENYFNKINNSSVKYEIAFHLAETYWYSATHHDTKIDFATSIKYLKLGLSIVDQYKFDKNESCITAFVLLINLGIGHFQLGQNYMINCKISQALENFSQSINYFHRIEHDSNQEFEAKYKIFSISAYCYENIGFLRNLRMESIEKALSYYEKVNQLVNSEIESITLLEGNSNEKLKTLEELKIKNEMYKQECLKRTEGFKLIKLCVDLWFNLRDMALNVNRKILSISYL